MESRVMFRIGPFAFRSGQITIWSVLSGFFLVVLMCCCCGLLTSCVVENNPAPVISTPAK